MLDAFVQGLQSCCTPEGEVVTFARKDRQCGVVRVVNHNSPMRVIRLRSRQ
jgi:hypothetical protein